MAHPKRTASHLITESSSPDMPIRRPRTKPNARIVANTKSKALIGSLSRLMIASCRSLYLRFAHFFRILAARFVPKSALYSVFSVQDSVISRDRAARESALHGGGAAGAQMPIADAHAQWN